jgi:RNA-directed DNA polymerase
MLKGHLNYFAVSGNHPSLWWFFGKVVFVVGLLIAD